MYTLKLIVTHNALKLIHQINWSVDEGKESNFSLQIYAHVTKSSGIKLLNERYKGSMKSRQLRSNIKLLDLCVKNMILVFLFCFGSFIGQILMSDDTFLKFYITYFHEFVTDLLLLWQDFLQKIRVPYQAFVQDTRVCNFIYNLIEDTLELLALFYYGNYFKQLRYIVHEHLCTVYDVTYVTKLLIPILVSLILKYFF